MAAQDAPPIGRDNDFARLASEAPQRFATVNFEAPDRAVPAGHGSPAAVARETDIPAAMVGPLQGSQFFAGFDVPEKSLIILTGREHSLPIGRHGHAPDLMLVPYELADFLARLQFPQAHLPLGRSADRNDLSAVG